MTQDANYTHFKGKGLQISEIPLDFSCLMPFSHKSGPKLVPIYLPVSIFEKASKAEIFQNNAIRVSDSTFLPYQGLMWLS